MKRSKVVALVAIGMGPFALAACDRRPECKQDEPQTQDCRSSTAHGGAYAGSAASRAGGTASGEGEAATATSRGGFGGAGDAASSGGHGGGEGGGGHGGGGGGE